MPVRIALLLLVLAGSSALAGASARAVDPTLASLRPAPAIRVPAGFRAEVYATGLRRPTALAWGPDGLLYATEEKGEVVAIGRGSTTPRVVATGFHTPLGLAWSGRLLYVSQSGGVQRLRLDGRKLVARKIVLARLPYKLHQQDNIVLGPDKRLYLGSGSTCNACRERDRRSAAVLSFRSDGTDLRVVSRGLRNPFGLAFQPGTNRLFVSENARDDLGTARAPEPAETVAIARPGARFGWPGCWASYRRLRLVGRCAGVTRPVAYLEPHSSADGLAFYTGRSFPRAYAGDLFVALWGTYYGNRFGRKVVRLRLDAAGRANPPRGSVFATGFGHPLALAVAPDGALLVADHGRGVLYAIQATR